MNDKAAEIWELYQKGVDHHRRLSMYSECEKYHNFYIGEQWKGAKVGDEELPVYNIIKPIGKYKISMIAQNQMSIVYLPMGGPELAPVTDTLTAFAASQWEKGKLDTLIWKVIKNAFITGDHYLYCFDDRKGTGALAPDLRPRLCMRSVGKTDIYFADERNPDISEQEYIIIAQRLPVRKVRQTARENGIPEEEIELITSDEETDTQIGETENSEVKNEDGKCTSILYMRKTKEGVAFLRSVRSVCYQPEQIIRGLDVYPVVGMRWEEQIGSARGASGVKQLIPNQLIINKTAARRALAVKRFAFPAAVYDSGRVRNIEQLSKIGAAIAVDALGQNKVSDFLQFLSPQPISRDAQNLQNELITQTRDLEGAGDAATGQVDPTKASGEAIKAARDQAAVPLNEQIASYKQLVEDIALMWYKMWAAYSPQGMQISFSADGENISRIIPAELIKGLDVDIKVEVSPVDPYSKISQQIALDRLLERGHISFPEYVSALDDASTVPKGKLSEILGARQPQGMEQMEAPPGVSVEGAYSAALPQAGGVVRSDLQ